MKTLESIDAIEDRLDTFVSECEENEAYKCSAPDGVIDKIDALIRDVYNLLKNAH